MKAHEAMIQSQYTSESIVTRLLAVLYDWISIPGRYREGIYSFLCRLQTGSGADPASYPMGT
jgi:hypothetical protein